jgi:hypothetical protein
VGSGDGETDGNFAPDSDELELYAAGCRGSSGMQGSSITRGDGKMPVTRRNRTQWKVN